MNDNPKIVIACSVARLISDLEKFADQEAMVMVEIDGEARQLKGLQKAALRIQGIEQSLVIIVGVDGPSAPCDDTETQGVDHERRN